MNGFHGDMEMDSLPEATVGCSHRPDHQNYTANNVRLYNPYELMDGSSDSDDLGHPRRMSNQQEAVGIPMAPFPQDACAEYLDLSDSFIQVSGVCQPMRSRCP